VPRVAIEIEFGSSADGNMRGELHQRALVIRCVPASHAANPAEIREIAESSLPWISFGVTIISLAFAIDPIHGPRPISWAVIAMGAVAMLVGCRAGWRGVVSCVHGPPGRRDFVPSSTTAPDALLEELASTLREAVSPTPVCSGREPTSRRAAETRSPVQTSGDASFNRASVASRAAPSPPARAPAARAGDSRVS
jgi:hypothetical protein